MGRTLIVTNDFPPRQGGIQSFVHALATRLPADDVVVYSSRSEGWEEYDRTLPFQVVRDRSSLLLPTRRVVDQARSLLRAEGCTSVLYGAAAPLALMSPALREAGARRQVACTHGHEVWWAMLPFTRSRLRRIGEGTDVVTYLGDYTRRRIAPALTPAARGRMVRLPPGVDPERFRPGAGGPQVRARLGIAADRPVVLCVSRLVARKGQDMLIRAWPEVLRRVPDALLLIAGTGPYRKQLDTLVASAGIADAVCFAGGLSEDDLPAFYDAANVFAMPCRTRQLGMDVEGLGIVYLEASATGLSVVVGNSGGAPDACRDGETGYVVDGTKPAEIADRISSLLLDPKHAAAMGQRGRAWVREEWDWDDHAARLRALLDL